jgi:adenylate kinase
LGAILISGTPGTGKTTLAMELAKIIKYKFIDMGELATSEHIYLKVDAKRNTKIIDERKLAKRLEKEIIANGGKVVASGHYAEILNPRLVERVIVLRTHPDELRRRLSQRGWSAEKIQENLEAEILGVCSSNVLTRYGKERVHEIDTTKLSPNDTLRIALDIIKSKDEIYAVGSINWLAELEKENKLGAYMSEKRWDA